MRLYQKTGVFLVLCFCAGVLQAQAPEQLSSSTWTYTLSPYAWGAGLAGDAAVFRVPSTHVKSNFSSLKNDLDFAAMALATARKGRLGFFADITYIKASAGASLSTGPVQELRVGAKAFTGLLGGGYAMWQGRSGHLDLVAAVRYWHVDVDVDVSLKGRSTQTIQRKDGGSWTDAMGGVRGVHYFTEQLYASGWALAGAGGSTFSWDVAAGIGYKINASLSAQAGYRALGVDYTHNHFKYKMVHKGPVLGLTWRF